MEFTNVVKTRQSIRKYKNNPINREIIKQIIETASLAPSWKNSQTARYHVVDTPEILKKIKDECLPDFNQENCKDAPVLLITSFIKNRSGYNRDGTPTNELENSWGAYDLGLHNQTALLQAAELGISSLVMGIRDEKKIKEILTINDGESIVSVIALGISDSSAERPKRKTVEEITTFY